MKHTDGHSPGPGRAESRARVDAERILNAAFDGTLDAAGHMQFAELLRSDPKFRARWAHTARTLARLRAETPGSFDRTDVIMARVQGVRGFRPAPARGRLVGTRVAWAAGLGLTLIGVAMFARSADRPGAAPIWGGPVASSDRGVAPPTSETPSGRAATTPRPVTQAPVLSLNNSDRYDRDVDFNIKSRVDSPSGGPTTLRVFTAADGRVLLTDFEPYPHAQAWRENSGPQPSWWIRAWTRTEPAWAGAKPGAK